MEHRRTFVEDAHLTLLVSLAVFLVNLVMETYFEAHTLIPMTSVLGVFLVSWKTDGYAWGIVASLISVFAVNYAFTFPYYAFNFSLPENLFSAVIMLVVSGLTSALTTQIKEQEKMRSEAALEKMRANLLRAVSHDLRTPLTSISGSTSVILENYDSLPREHQLKLLEEIREDSDWLIRMVENLLSVTRIDGDRVAVIKTPTVLEELIDTTLVKFRKRYPAQAVSVTIPEEFISIPMDAMLIEQVLVNLLENAVLHAAGMTQLSLTVRAEGRQAVFEVADDGAGISAERLPTLFSGCLSHEENTPADSTRRNMGIGLSVCATIIRAHGGRLTAANRPGGGALFCFDLEMEEMDYE